MNANLLDKIGHVIAILESIRRELALEAVVSVVFPEHRKALIEQGICLSCEEPILPGENEVRKVHERCRKEQVRSGRTDDELVSMGLLAPISVTGRKKVNRLERTIAMRLGEVADSLPRPRRNVESKLREAESIVAALKPQPETKPKPKKDTPE